MEIFIGLIKQGISTSEILVICANKFKQKKFTEKIKEKLSESDLLGFGNFQIYTFNGIVYNSILNNWPVVEDLIQKENPNSVIIPNLSGLEAAEFLLKKIINEINETNQGFADYYPAHNLIHQLLRRYRLIVENKLTKSEIEHKSAFLKEEFAKEADDALDNLRKKSLSLRCLDYLRQTDIFSYLLENKLVTFNHVKYLIADDYDELSFSAQFFIKSLLPHVKDYYLAADSPGGSRMGYLCACPEDWEKITQGKEVIKLTSLSGLKNDAESLFYSIKPDFKNNKKILEINNISLIGSLKKTEMLDLAMSKIGELIFDHKISPEDIVIISPAMDDSTRFSLTEFFSFNKIKYQFLSGSKKFFDDTYVFGSLIICQLINNQWNLKPSDFEIRLLFTRLLNFPLVICDEIVKKYKKNKTLDENIKFEFEEYSDKYQNLINLIISIKEDKQDLYNQLTNIFTRIISPYLNESTDLKDFNKMLKSIKDFQYLKARFELENIPISERDWIIQMKNTVVSDTPPSVMELIDNAVKIATPQMVIDNELISKIQIWLDVSSQQWTKNDIGPLYNSWVFQKSWEGNEYSPEIHNELTMNKTAHLIRKLVFCADEKILAFSCQSDTTGNENTGILCRHLNKITDDNSVTFTPIIPREDQKPILDYKGGKFAVPAVPGAGKTTIMLALILKLINDGVKPSEILVLTYMESAARNFQAKIKKYGIDELPFISTFHGLAFKIIQDEDNFIKLGLNPDFDICDDTIRPRLIEDICLKYIPVGEDRKRWIDTNSKAISKAKLGYIKPYDILVYLNKHSNQQLEEFLPIFTEYNRILKEKNMIDFDDFLVLTVRLLKENPAIKKMYQRQFKYIIEDEAQDSSSITAGIYIHNRRRPWKYCQMWRYKPGYNDNVYQCRF